MLKLCSKFETPKFVENFIGLPMIIVNSGNVSFKRLMSMTQLYSVSNLGESIHKPTIYLSGS